MSPLDESHAAMLFIKRIKNMERYRSGHNEAVLKTVCLNGRVGSNPTLSALVSAIWRSTQVVEGVPLEREQIVNSDARVQIPPSPSGLLNSLLKLGIRYSQRRESLQISRFEKNSKKVKKVVDKKVQPRYTKQADRETSTMKLKA